MSLINALKSYTPCDEDGVMCKVSRQAVDEAIHRISKLEAEVKGKTNAIDQLNTWLKEREKYWRDWNGRAANRAAMLEAENEQLRETCVEFERRASEERIQQSNRNSEHHAKTMKRAIEWKKDAERWQETMLQWGEGVEHGFGDFWDNISANMTKEEQQAAIDAARE